MSRLADDLRFPLRSAAFAGLTFTLLAGLEGDRALRGNTDEVLYTWMHRYGVGLLRLYGLEATALGPHVSTPGGRYPGRDARGMGRLFVMNHRSLLDIFVNLAFIEANIVSRADLSRWPVIGLAARRVGTLFVDRSSRQSGAAVIQAMTSAIERGRGVMVYPEGTTFLGDEVHPFRPGGFVAAERVSAEIVPVGIAYGTDDAAFGDEPFIHHLRRISGARRTRVGIAFGDPIPPPHGDVEAVKERARAEVQALVRAARAAIGGAAG
jgi:1-acyl-sn-glycerol-3-phosphate acyltransferase